MITDIDKIFRLAVVLLSLIDVELEELRVVQVGVASTIWKTVLLKASLLSNGVSRKTLMSVCHDWFTIVSDDEWKENQRRLLRQKKTAGKTKRVTIEGKSAFACISINLLRYKYVSSKLCIGVQCIKHYNDTAKLER